MNAWNGARQQALIAAAQREVVRAGYPPPIRIRGDVAVTDDDVCVLAVRFG